MITLKKITIIRKRINNLTEAALILSEQISGTVEDLITLDVNKDNPLAVSANHVSDIFYPLQEEIKNLYKQLQKVETEIITSGDN